MTKQLHGIGRFEWERIVLRARLDGFVNRGKQRGAVSGAAFKAVALAWSSHADADGTSIKASFARISVEAEVSYRTARDVLGALIDLGLTERVKSGARRLGRPDEYRLMMPTDLLDRLRVLTPDEMKSEVGQVIESVQRRSTGTSGASTTKAAPDVVVLVPAEPVETGCTGSAGALCTDSIGQGYQSVDGYRSDTTDPQPVREPVTVRARKGREEDPISRGEEVTQPIVSSGNGCCLVCYAEGRYTLAADTEHGSACAYHGGKAPRPKPQERPQEPGSGPADG